MNALSAVQAEGHFRMVVAAREFRNKMGRDSRSHSHVDAAK
jgi:hypothetical protein